ncbi:MAG TPA: tetratricopeptide repeat protein, partial [Polyangia bacterium]|nr:tetratricopeptide repeat protein [Polyangia bacterium]
MKARKIPAGALAATIAVVAAAGCAAVPPRSATPAREEGLAAWDVLADGRRAEAEAAFEKRLRAAPGDAVALFGRASIDYERGRPDAASDGYAAVLTALAQPHEEGFIGGQLLAPVAAGRLLSLYDEVGTDVRARIMAKVRPAELARSTALPWLARVELLRLATHAAREAGDANTLAAVAETSGCATVAADLGLIGPLANADLDAPVPAATRAPASWRVVNATGCRVDLPSTPDGRGGARLVRVAFETASDGRYDVVVDYAGEARLFVDGGEAQYHGSTDRYGPRISATHFPLGAGRHTIELRLATRAAVAGFALHVLEAYRGSKGGTAARVRFVDPRASGAPARVVSGEHAPDAGPDLPNLRYGGPLGIYCNAAIAQRVEATDEALSYVARLRAQPRFALGQALAGAVAHDDPSRPASIARDTARSALRTAVAVDPGLARAWHDLAALALEDERPRDAIEAGVAAARAAPGWYAPQLLLARAFTLRGLDHDANRAVEAAAQGAASDRVGERGVSLREPVAGGMGPSQGPILNDDARLRATPCPVIEALRRRAQDRRALELEARLEAALATCGGNVEARVERMRARGDVSGAVETLRTAIRLDPERNDLVGDLAVLLSSAGKHDEALAEIARLVARDPNDPQRRLRLADAQAAAGQATAARETIAALLASRPDVPEVQHAARALGVPLPLDEFRVDGRATIRAFQAAAVRYTAPAVMVLDRAVMRVFPNGTVMTLTHQIVRVDSKDAVDKWAEIAIPAGAEILNVRTHKRDGSTREPEEISGKETISAADVALGDFIEWEYLETRGPSAAFAPGFLVDRFFFQSFDAPMARSELLLVAPAGVDVELDARAGAPRPQTRAAVDGTRITSFQATGVPQLFAERAAVPAIEYVPSVRASAGVGWRRWARYLGEEIHDTLRATPELREQARRIAEAARTRPGDRRRALA